MPTVLNQSPKTRKSIEGNGEELIEMEELLQYAISYFFSFALLFLFCYRRRRWRLLISGGDRAKCFGFVAGFDKKPRKGVDEYGYVYRLQVKYTTEKEGEIVSLSKNTIHSPEEYSIGETIEISYLLNDPESFYICDDKNREVLNRIILACSIVLCLMSTLFIFI